MKIIEALQHEESRLRRQLTAVQSAIAALDDGGMKAASPVRAKNANGGGGKRTLSAAGRANIIRAAKARWAKIRAENAKKRK